MASYWHVSYRLCSPLQGAGASHEAGDAAAEDKCFYTRTDSLDVWLHQERFRYQLHAIQRPYEWRKTQVVG